MKCRNCGAELVETSKGKYLHAVVINIGNAEHPHNFVAGKLVFGSCIYPEV